MSKVYERSETGFLVNHEDAFVNPKVLINGKLVDLPSLTEQHHINDCDINVLMKRYPDGNFPGLIQREPMYGDFSDIPDYQASLDLVEKVHEQFMALPVELRTELRNNPANLEPFLADPSNLEKARKYGLLKEAVVLPESAAAAIKAAVPQAPVQKVEEKGEK